MEAISGLLFLVISVLKNPSRLLVSTFVLRQKFKVLLFIQNDWLIDFHHSEVFIQILLSPIYLSIFFSDELISEIKNDISEANQRLEADEMKSYRTHSIFVWNRFSHREDCSSKSVGFLVKSCDYSCLSSFYPHFCESFLSNWTSSDISRTSKPFWILRGFCFRTRNLLKMVVFSNAKGWHFAWIKNSTFDIVLY